MKQMRVRIFRNRHEDSTEIVEPVRVWYSISEEEAAASVSELRKKLVREFGDFAELFIDDFELHVGSRICDVVRENDTIE